MSSLPPSLSLARNWIGFVGLAIALVWWGWWASRGWQVEGMAVHEFRQAQTALSIQAMQRDGFRVDYATPVLGKPWSIPMEFPIYQWAVVTYCDWTGVNIVTGGRWVSAWCFLLGIPALILILREAGFSLGASAVGVVPVLLAPTYLFFSRTVMIESMAWAFSAWFLVGIFRFRRTGALRWVGLALVAGGLAVLVKSTTWAAFCLPWAGLFFVDCWRTFRTEPKAWKSLVIQSMGIGVPLLLLGFWWVAKADAIKAQNPMADFLLSTQLTSFNFGTWAERMEQGNWKTLLGYWESGLLPWWALAAGSVVALLLPRSRAVAGLALLGFAGAQSIFFGLYEKHDYYFYANGAMACVVVGAVAAALWDQAGKRLIGIGAALAITVGVGVLQHSNYRAGYLSHQIAPMHGSSPLADAIKTLVAPDEVVVIQAPDWNSTIAFQAERRTLIIPDFQMFLDPEKAKKSTRFLADETVPLVFVMRESIVHARWLVDRIDDFELWPAPLFETETGVRAFARRDRFESIRQRLIEAPLYGIKLVPPEPLAPNEKRIAILPGTPDAEKFAELKIDAIELVSPLGVHSYVDDGELRLATHASTELYVNVPDRAKGVSYRYGVNPNSLAEEYFDGFTVQLEFVYGDGRHERIHSEWMSPNSEEAVRVVQVDFEGKFAPILVVRVMNGPRNDGGYDQVWLNELTFE